ncbi:hypothetical protein NBRC116493_14070 [Aurantivibrio infirmus]
MKVNQLKLSEDALNKLRQIALTVELEENKRFSVRHDVDQVVQLLEFATKLDSPSVAKRIADFKMKLSDDSLGFFRTLGVSLEPQISTTSSAGSQKTYRGQKILQEETSTSSTAASEIEPKKKKKIMYRGKVTYV